MSGVGHKRKLRVNLDSTQYYQDIQSGLDLYEKFNLLVRRDPKENNFKAVLHTIRSLLEDHRRQTLALPTWLRGVVLGNADPNSALFR
jgi:intron-binding protein aquarius